MSIDDKARNIKLLISDIDGVLTDGSIIYGNFGDEIKGFSVHDGLGIKLLKRYGIETVLLTSRKSRIVKIRAKDLKIKDIIFAEDKFSAFNKIIRKKRVTPEEVCYIGDDLLDLRVLKAVGLSVSVPNAVTEVKERVDMVTSAEGGRGAVREVCRIILTAKDAWDDIVEGYLT